MPRPREVQIGGLKDSPRDVVGDIRISRFLRFHGGDVDKVRSITSNTSEVGEVCLCCAAPRKMSLGRQGIAPNSVHGILPPPPTVDTLCVPVCIRCHPSQLVQEFAHPQFDPGTPSAWPRDVFRGDLSIRVGRTTVILRWVLNLEVDRLSIRELAFRGST